MVLGLYHQPSVVRVLTARLVTHRDICGLLGVHSHGVLGACSEVRVVNSHNKLL